VRLAYVCSASGGGFRRSSPGYELMIFLGYELMFPARTADFDSPRMETLLSEPAR